MPKSMVACFPALLCLFFTEIANKKRKFVDILEQSLPQTGLCAILRLTSNKHGLPEKSFFSCQLTANVKYMFVLNDTCPFWT